jgi:hypothetical protein
MKVVLVRVLFLIVRVVLTVSVKKLKILLIATVIKSGTTKDTKECTQSCTVGFVFTNSLTTADYEYSCNCYTTYTMDRAPAQY